LEARLAGDRPAGGLALGRTIGGDVPALANRRAGTARTPALQNRSRVSGVTGGTAALTGEIFMLSIWQQPDVAGASGATFVLSR